jgi:transcriptional regulator with XRE-family HTH domain
MNNLKWMREQSSLLLKDVSKYTGLSIPVIQRIETGQRPFRENHLNLLSKFFWVSADFMLGNTDKGIYAMNWDAEVEIMTRDQFIKATGHVSTSIIGPDNNNFYSVYRKLDETYSKNCQNVMDRAINDLNKMDEDQLKQTIKFMEDFILK